MLFISALFLFFGHTYCKEYVLDESLKVTELHQKYNESEKFHTSPSAFSFICQAGLENNGTHCVGYQSSSNCEELKNINYSIGPYRADNGTHRMLNVTDGCSYRIEDILSAHSKEDNSVTLQLFLDTAWSPYRLYLDITTKKPIEYVESNIFCWSKRYQIKPVEITELFANIPNKETRRFALTISSMLKSYFCHFVPFGKMKPALSNFVFASDDTAYTFTVKTYIKRSQQQRIAKNERLLLDNWYTGNDGNNSSVIIVAANQSLDRQEVFSLLGVYGLNGQVENINSNQFCLSLTETFRISNSNGTNQIINITWPETGVNAIGYPVNKICIDNDNKLLIRKCKDNSFGAEWSKITPKCSDGELPKITKILLDIQKESFPQVYLSKISDILEENAHIQDVDLFLITNILTKALDLQQIDDDLLIVVDRVLNMNPEAFTKYTIGKFFNFIQRCSRELLEDPTKCRKAYLNINCVTAQPFLNETNSVDYQFNSTNVNVTFPKHLLNSFNLSDEERESFVISVVVFQNTTLFSKTNITEIIVDVSVSKRFDTFEHPLVIRFKKQKSVKLKCVYWETTITKWSSVGISTNISDDVIECYTYHLTRFALLIVPDDVIDELAGTYFDYFDLVSTIECGLSILGVLFIIIVAVVSPEWGKKRCNVIHLCFIILLELSMLITFSFVPYIQTYCLYIGASLQLIVLVKHCVMLLIAKTHLHNFMGILKREKKIKEQISYFQLILAWSIPICVVVVSAVLFPNFFKPGKFNICYPQEELLFYSVILPVSIIVAVNSITFTFIMLKISTVKTGKLRKTILHIKLAAMLWFLLGGTWFFSILINIFPGETIAKISYCIFWFVAPLQGFVIFVFYVILDKNTRFSWFSSDKSTS